MKLRHTRFLLVGLIAALAFAGCDDDDDGNGGSNGGITDPPLDDLAEFTGAWVIHSSGTPQYFCGDETCRQQLESVIDTHFDIPAVDSTCVRVDSLQHLVLVEPYRSSGTTTGQAIDTQAAIECEYVSVVAGDTLVTEISADILAAPMSATISGFYTVSVHPPGGTECASCRVLLGIQGIRRVTGDCEPLP